MKAKHTPTPWSSENGFISAKGTGVGGLVAKVVMPVVISADQEHMRDANAEFIVRACNSHEQLVAALQEAKEALKHSRAIIETPESKERHTDARKTVALALVAAGAT